MTLNFLFILWFFILPPPVADPVSLHLFAFQYVLCAIMSASTHVFFTWLHIPSGGVGGCDNVSVHLLTSSMLRSTRLLYLLSHSFWWGGGVANRSLPSQACGWTLPEKWEDKMVERSQLARKLRTNAGITWKISFQTVSIQRMRRTNFWMLRSGTMSTNGTGDTIIAMPCGKWFPRFSKNFKWDVALASGEGKKGRMR